MRSKIHWLALFALLASLVVNALVFAALAASPAFGQGVRIAAHFSSPLAWLYLQLGNVLLLIPGALDVGLALVESAWSPLFDQLRATPQVALDILLDADDSASQVVLAANYWATPILFVAWLFFWWRRPRDVHLVRHRRR